MATRIERKDVVQLLGTYWLPVGLYLALIFALSSIPGFNVPGSLLYKDKIAHLVEYAVLGWLVHRAARATWPEVPAYPRVLLTLIGIALFGAADEVFQAGTPGRDSSILDWLADTLGATLAVLMSLSRERRRGAA